ncbi:uncharacterized protein V1516DRAFT_687977 [Lipomyces oligophaga]|uniref:uncharacterized protein n=1 Tax=Lipomyces oligophaga TaxID=45792 RepID=UPI0034CD3DB4
MSLSATVPDTDSPRILTASISKSLNSIPPLATPSYSPGLTSAPVDSAPMPGRNRSLPHPGTVPDIRTIWEAHARLDLISRPLVSCPARARGFIIDSDRPSYSVYSPRGANNWSFNSPTDAVTLAVAISALDDKDTQDVESDKDFEVTASAWSWEHAPSEKLARIMHLTRLSMLYHCDNKDIPRCLCHQCCFTEIGKPVRAGDLTNLLGLLLLLLRYPS